jgi:carbonic anhydrase
MIGARPTQGLAIVTCMDARLDLLTGMGLSHGDAHILRNAGGVITEDVIRSLSVSQRALGTTRVMIVHHTDCGLLRLDDEEFRDELTRDAVSNRRSRFSRSPTRMRRCALRSRESAPHPTSPIETRSAASCTKSRAGPSAR